MKPGRSLAWLIGIGTGAFVIGVGLCIYLLLSIQSLQSETHAQGQNSHAILVHLQGAGARRSAEIAQLNRSNKTLSEIFAAAAVEEENLLSYDKAICAALPNCVAPTLLPVPPVKGDP